MCGIAAFFSTIPTDLLGSLKEDLSTRGPDCSKTTRIDESGGAVFCGAVLHIQGSSLTPQPFEDGYGNVLLWNGEVFGFESTDDVTISSVLGDKSDTIFIANLLEDSLSNDCNNHSAITNILAKIQGPYAFVYFHRASNVIYFGRDPFGRRSLLMLTCVDDGRVAGVSSVHPRSITPFIDIFGSTCVWNQVPIVGVYSINLQTVTNHLDVPKYQARLTPWPASRVRLGRTLGVKVSIGGLDVSSSIFLEKLRLSVLRRVQRFHQYCDCGLRRLEQSKASDILHTSAIGVLFSGGIDSILLAVLLHLTLPEYVQCIELINVSFASAVETHREQRTERYIPSPDRLAAILALSELEALFPSRVWRLVHVDVDSHELAEHESRIRQLLKPNDTHMDLNIGTAFWFAARGKGYFMKEGYNSQARECALSEMGGSGRPLVRVGADSAAKSVGLETWQQKASPQALDKVCVPLSVAVKIGDSGPACSNGPPCRRIKKQGCVLGMCKRCCLKLSKEINTKCAVHKVSTATVSHEVCIDNSIGEAPIIATDNMEDTNAATAVNVKVDYTCRCRVLLIGIGADEQMAGYSRHRTVYVREGLDGLEKELHRDMERLWERNLGRDDRCISDHAKEPWYPYLDEELVSFLQSLPINDLANLEEGPGIGDKKILRLAAKAVGLSSSSEFVKRAIQFGTRIAQVTNSQYYGSHRKGKGQSKI